MTTETVKISNDDSILQSVKKLLGPGAECTDFDQDILMYINGVFMELQQLGVGPEEGFEIFDDTAKWTDFVQDTLLLNPIKPYIYLKVKLIFDPPTSASVITSFENLINRFEWRINQVAESLKDSGKEEGQND